jgi:hypothetical protein
MGNGNAHKQSASNCYTLAEKEFPNEHKRRKNHQKYNASITSPSRHSPFFFRRSKKPLMGASPNPLPTYKKRKENTEKWKHPQQQNHRIKCSSAYHTAIISTCLQNGNARATASTPKYADT